LQLAVAAGLLSWSGYRLKEIFFPARVSPAEEETLATYLDTLIPPDQTPGAAELGVAGKIIEKTRSDRLYRRMIKKGLGWLDRRAKSEHGRVFALLGEEDRVQVVTGASLAFKNSSEYIFFEKTRRDAFFHYYAHPESWVGLGYDGPPQPMGFPDYASPPDEGI
jgi:hypothetical protein